MGWQLMGRRVGGELVSASWGCFNKWTALGGSPHEKRGASQSRGWRAEVEAPGWGWGLVPHPACPPAVSRVRLSVSSLLLRISVTEFRAHLNPG